MQYKTIFKYLTSIFATLCLAFLLCAIMSFVSDAHLKSEAIQGWRYSIFISLLLVLICYFLGRNAPKQIFRREAFCIIGFGWTLSCFVGALPFFFIIKDMHFFDAFFEATSGFTTTGASVIPDVTKLPTSLIFWRSLTQWMGGMGVAVLFVALLSGLGAGAKILYSNDPAASTTELESGRVQVDAFKIFRLYIILSLLCSFALYLQGMSVFDSLCIMFSTVSTGGFSTGSSSIITYPTAFIEYTVDLFMVIGATSFILILRTLKSGPKTLLKNTEFIFFILTLFIVSLIVAFYLNLQFKDFGFAHSFRLATFQVITLMTTTGFASFDYDQAMPIVHVLLLIIMTLGACSASTAGGIKLFRVVSSAKIILYQLQRSFRPKLVRSILIDTKPLALISQSSITTHIVLALSIIFLSLPLSLSFDPHLSIEGSLSAIITCFSNVGPGFAEVGPSHDFGFLSSPNKVLLCLIMLLGRIEFYAILVLFLPSFWKKSS